MYSSSVIQHVLSAKGSSGCPVSFFFAQADDTSSLNSNIILRSILCQRLTNANISEDMEAKIRKAASTSAFSDILDPLREVSSATKESYIILDGLDECDKKDRKEVFKALSTLISSNNNMRLFLSGRNSLQEEVKLNFTGVERMELGGESTDEDIAAYIEGFLEEKIEDGDLKVGDPALLSEVQNVLTEGAQGM